MRRLAGAARPFETRQGRRAAFAPPGLGRYVSRRTAAFASLLIVGCADSPAAPSPPTPARVVFVSSVTFPGATGGVAGADRACAALAAAAGVAGVYRAWLSDEAGHSPSERFTRGGAPFVMISGVRVADDWEDLTDGVINNPIVVDERGGQPETVPVVWTGTDAAGRPVSGATCAGWSTGSADARGQMGAIEAIGPGWSTSRSAGCDQPGRLYCVEQ